AAAVEALRHWLGRNSFQNPRLKAVLERKYTNSDVKTILHLLRMPGVEDLQERSTYEFPIDHLGNENPAIRHLAAWHLYRLTPAEMRKQNQLVFDPYDDPMKREAVQKRWRKLFDEGRLPPKN